MRKQSVAVLDDADRFEDILNWQLFKAEQAQVLWGEADVHPWRPGDAMFRRPDGGLFGGEQYIRPLLELIEYDGLKSDYVPRCDDCEIWWAGDEPCWMCGETRNWRAIPFPDRSHTIYGYNPFIQAREAQQAELYSVSMDVSFADDLWREMWARVNRSMRESADHVSLGFRRMGESVRGLRTSMMIMDEVVAFDVETFRPVADEAFRWFERPDVDIRTVIDDHLSPAPVLLAGVEFAGNTQILVMPRVHQEREIPLPGPLFAEFIPPEHLTERRDNNVSNRRNNNPRRPQ